uniref:Uncharacterized protein n=1 Tax=Physcomitrium patens TaxID=3218 RepID=A0A2K1JQ22_PHYPA|nr:hypothetical protein PHYPA_016023 [Physcomitrium patens]
MSPRDFNPGQQISQDKSHAMAFDVLHRYRQGIGRRSEESTPTRIQNSSVVLVSLLYSDSSWDPSPEQLGDACAASEAVHDLCEFYMDSFVLTHVALDKTLLGICAL